MHASNRILPKSRLALAAVAAGLLLAAPAHAVLKAIEQAIETSTDAVRLPDRVPATVSVSVCSTSCPSSVRFTDQTRFFIGAREVSLRALLEHARDRTTGLTVFYDPKTNDVHRVVAD